MGSKIVHLLVILSIAFALLITSEVAARDLPETETTTGPEGASLHHGGRRVIIIRHRRPRRGHGCRHRCHGRCCSAAEEAALKATQVIKPQN